MMKKGRKWSENGEKCTLRNFINCIVDLVNNYEVINLASLYSLWRQTEDPDKNRRQEEILRRIVESTDCRRGNYTNLPEGNKFSLKCAELCTLNGVGYFESSRCTVTEN